MLADFDDVTISRLSAPGAHINNESPDAATPWIARPLANRARGSRHQLRALRGKLLRAPEELPVHRTARTRAQTLVRERQRDVPHAAAHGRLGEGPVHDVALGMTAADAPEVEAHRQQQRDSRLMAAAVKLQQALDQRDADLAPGRRRFIVARRGLRIAAVSVRPAFPARTPARPSRHACRGTRSTCRRHAPPNASPRTSIDRQRRNRASQDATATPSCWSGCGPSASAKRRGGRVQRERLVV